MKVEIEYTELLDIVNALLPRAAHFERLPAESAGLEPDHWQREATKHRAIADKLLAQADDTDDEDDANASLMVAAPDLLAALERMLAHGERGNLYTARGEDAEVVNQARAAIAKAKGHSG